MPNELSDSTKALMEKVAAEPNNWQARKAAAVQLYEEEHFLEAADTVWNAPEMPSVDTDVAFAVKIVSRARPNRSIRLVYEVLRRNAGKPEQNIALARAFNMIGLPMLASRFYGAALATSHDLFDIGFEQQSLWFDDSGSLMETWEKSSQDIKVPFVNDISSILGEEIKPSDLAQDVTAPIPNSTAPVGASVTKPAALGNSPVLRAATSVVRTKPAIKPAQPVSKRPTAPTPIRPAQPAKRPASAPVPLRPAAPNKSGSTGVKPALPPLGDKAPKPMQPDADS
jgi:hypothetical protein